MIDHGRLSRVKKLQVFSIGAIFLIIIFSFSFISNVSLHSVASETKRNLQELQTHKARQPLKLTSSPEPHALKEENPEAYTEDHAVKEDSPEAYTEDHDHLVPPINVTAEERIAWFKKKLPEFKILQSTRFTQQFDGRVREFLRHKCKVRFFMTWISPTTSFMGQREFLAMESLFKSNPHGCLIVLSRSMDSVAGDRIFKPLRDRGFKIMAITPDLPFLFKNTPAESWLDDMKSGNKDPGEIPLAQNLSNLIRLAVLYQYGGVYLDTDFIVLKDFSGLRNSVGAQSTDVSGKWTRLNNAVLVFDRNHPLLYKFIKEFANTFDGNRWGHNGPYLVSRVVEKVRKTRGSRVTVLLPMAFYPVDWTKIAGFFTRPNDRAYSKWVEAKLLQLKRETYGVHLWNRQSSGLRIEEGSIIGRLISENCVICEPLNSS
ncbi:unnamed protein product [Ilex paraguariensis]|uniref:Alpha 1,4-glycosyltransferase domain-containing protein n=1 Tax=Ilex paraguariensis TaxID=185542 RepID=A0ABC8QMJ5_9AQUA